MSESVLGADGPPAGRPTMPPGYAVPDTPVGELPWEWVEAQLTRSRNYWVCTTRPDGRPHAMPVWGLWLDGAVVFSTDPTSRKARNLAANPAAVVHLESGEDAVVAEGAVEPVRDADLLRRIVERYDEKYAFRPDPSQPQYGVYALRPRVVLAWRERDFPTTATRWTFPGQTGGGR